MTDKTQRLYFENPYQIEFEAEVVKRLRKEDSSVLILDQTCFYPESGGQPSDKGWINGVAVVKVAEEEDRILHFLVSEVSADKIKGKLDWKTRFDHMQQHSGQHVLSQSFYEIFKADTLSFHLGEETSTVEIDLRKTSEKDVRRVEHRANEIIFQNRDIKAIFVTEDEIGAIPLRKPPKKMGAIRVVEVHDFDHSACGGTHVKRTGEIGLIKILKWERIRENVRFEFVCGWRALEDYIWKNESLRQLSNRLSAQERELQPSIEKLFVELKSLKKRSKMLSEKISQYQALELIQMAGGKIIREVFVERAPEELKYLALNIIRRGDFIVLFGLKVEGRVHVVLACSESLEIDMKQLIPLVSPLIKGRGGGSPSLVELVGEGVESLESALDQAVEFLMQFDRLKL